ncbi:hypothetical protein [Actinoplanes sp. NPDC026619]|uniref:hypothetical protein n=1 Tax=Actinoplanes sp. NPDC026619 TaxID=3155798 RepID=UPI0033C533CA
MQPSTPTTVLTLDYPGYEERPRITGLIDAGLDCVPLMRAPLPRRPEAIGYAETLLAARSDERPVRAIVAYCMTSPIAHEVARMTAARDGLPVLLVALDGAPCPDSLVAQEYATLVRRFGGEGPPRVVPTRDELIADPAGVLAAMAAELTEVATRATADGEPDEITVALVRDLVGKSSDWLTQLVAAHNALFPPWPGEMLLIVSRDHPFAGPWPGAAASRVHRVDCSREELLRHPDTRRYVAEAIGTRRPG